MDVERGIAEEEDATEMEAAELLDTALRMYDLQHVHVIDDKGADTKVTHYLPQPHQHQPLS